MTRTFDKRMAALDRGRRRARVGRMREAHPVAGAVLAPLAHVMLFRDDRHKTVKGDSGESAVSRALARLPDTWLWIDDLVLRHGRNQHQIDHVAIGPNGVFVIETKHWRGRLQGENDAWRLHDGERWHGVDSPTEQNRTHCEAVARQLEAYGVRAGIASVVVFVDSDGVEASACTGYVLSDPGALPGILTAHPSRDRLLPFECERIARTLLQGSLPPAAKAPPAADRAPARGAPPQASRSAPAPAPAGATPPVLPAVAAIRPPQILAPAQAPAAGPSSNPPPVPMPMPAADARTVGRSVKPATDKQRDHVRSLLRRAGVPFSEARLARLTDAEAQAVIDRLRFRRDVPVPDLR